MKIALASDHAGYQLKREIAVLKADGHETVDHGPDNEDPCDLPDFVYPASLAVARGEAERGIFVDGVGYGSAMIANKVYGVYAAVARTRSARASPGRTRTPTCSASAARSSARRWPSRSSRPG